ncbi:proline-rich receptor-like protein kinase PERK12 [Lathyrus oleraceus]|uniref:proline-rich receptor-like protein kinase PERK12 n=1 Tax=Pisum sativum TaxID=3888 RepID=UPI0021CEBA76|nr:proline-rich receptor-like protein kinase PERK12 [Pisum sativum]
MDWLPEHPPNFMKRMREPSDKSKKAKKAKLGETSGSTPPVPLADSPSKSITLSRSVKLKLVASSLPQTTPVYTSSETPPLTTRTSNPPSLKFNLATTTLPISEAKMLNETTSPSSSSSPKSPPYYVLSSDNEPSDPQSPTLAQLHARALASQQPSQTEPELEVTFPPPEQQNPTTSEQPQTPPPAQQPNQPPEQPIHSPSEPQPNPQPEQTTPSPSAIPIPPTSVATITPILNLYNTNQTSLSSLASAFEPDTSFPTIAVEAEEKADVETATATAATEAEEKAKASAKEATRIAAEEAAKTRANALTQGEQSNSGFAPLVLKTLEELQKEQQVVRARLDHQDSVNTNIQNMLT